MALSAELKTMLELIIDPAVREARTKELEELDRGYMRQSDYSRRSNELDEKVRTHDAWFEGADAEYRKALEDVKVANKELEDLRVLKNKTEGGLNPAEEAVLARQVKAATDAAEAARKEAEALKGRLDEVSKTIFDKKSYEEDVVRRGDNLGAAIFKIADLQDQYHEDFGKRLDRNKLIAEAQKLGGDIDKAYENITKDDYKVKGEKNIEDEVNKRLNERLQKANLPMDQSGEAPLGPLQKHLVKSDESKIPNEVSADGSGRLGSLIAQELRSEGKY
jgi:hypothetical protein